MGKRKFKVTGDSNEPDDVKLAPHSFVITRGKVAKPLTELMESMRKVMSPYTAASLKQTSKNVLKDYVAIAGTLHISHLVIFSQTKVSPVMKIARLPQGPTVYFRINNFSTIADVLNNFDYSLKHHTLTSTMLQNMFPKLSVSKLNLKKIKRVVLFHYDSTQDVIEFRQYRIRLLVPDMSRSVKKLTSSMSKRPDLSSYQDIADYITKSGFSSAGSDIELTRVVESANPTAPRPNIFGDSAENEDVPKKKKLRSRRKLAVRLIEFGPRMQLKLYKIEQGICEGEVFYHSVYEKSAEEMDDLIAKHKRRRKRPKHQFTEQNPNRTSVVSFADQNDKKSSVEQIKYGFNKGSNAAKKPKLDE